MEYVVNFLPNIQGMYSNSYYCPLRCVNGFCQLPFMFIDYLLVKTGTLHLSCYISVTLITILLNKHNVLLLVLCRKSQ